MARRSSKQPGATSPPAAPPERPAPARSRAWLHVAALVFISLGVYANCLSNSFVSDDDFQVLANKTITDTKFIPQLFTSNVWSFAQSDQTNYYRPLFMLLYMGEYFLFGFDPFGWHCVNLAAHIAALLAAYFLARALGGERLAFVAGVLFALHPIHVEAVVWVAVLTDLVCGLALFAGALAFHRAREGVAPRRNLLLAALAFAAGLLTKETALVFPALLVAYEFLYRRASPLEILRGWKRYTAFAAVLLAYLPARLHALGGKFAPSSGAHFQLTPWEMGLSVPALLAQYVGALFWPVNLNYYHPFAPVRSVSWQTVVGALLAVALVAVMFRLRARAPLLAFSAAWFVLTLAPVLSISNVGENVFTERYLYIPSLGFCVALAWGWLAAYERASQPQARVALAAALTALCIVSAAIIVRRNPDWKDDITLFTRTAQQSPNSATIQMNLGYIWSLHGRDDLAMDYYQRSLALDPNRALTHNNFGNSLTNRGRYDEAIVHLKRATELKPDYHNAWLNLGLVYAAKQEWPAAILHYRRGIEIRENFPEAWTALGLACWNSGQPQEAIAAYRQALSFNPDYLEALINLASGLSETGAGDEAIAHLQHALQISPQGPHASVIHFNLGVNYERKQQFRAALGEYERSYAANPNFTLARQRADAIRPRVESVAPPLTPSLPPPVPKSR